MPANGERNSLPIHRADGWLAVRRYLIHVRSLRDGPVGAGLPARWRSVAHGRSAPDCRTGPTGAGLDQEEQQGLQRHAVK